MKIPGIVVILFPVAIFGLYIGINEWWQWVNCDTRDHLGMMILSSEDKIRHSIGTCILIYIASFAIDCIQEKVIMTYPLVFIYKILEKFIKSINKHLTITI